MSHDAGELEKFATLSEQLPYRRDMILSLLKEANVSLEDVDVFVGRGGGLQWRGRYIRSDGSDARSCEELRKRRDPSGSLSDRSLPVNCGEQYGAKAMVVNPPDVDELQDLARMTGIKGVNRVIHLHALEL